MNQLFSIQYSVFGESSSTAAANKVTRLPMQYSGRRGVQNS